jgi:flavin reductase (DIM6/NTAB) family NADH-FMN oxidoreductase RutF
MRSANFVGKSLVAPMMTGDALRAVTAHIPSPVAVVTTQPGGSGHGTTASAFLSLSMDPPMLLVSLHNSSTLLSRVRPGVVVA